MSEKVQTGIEFTLDDEKARAGAKRLGGALGELADKARMAADRVKNTGRSIAGSTLAQLGLGMGIVEIGRKMIDLNKESAAAQKGITGALFAFQHWKKGVDPITRINASMVDSGRIMEDLHKSEQRLAVSHERLAGTYADLAGPMIDKFGASQKQVTTATIKAAEASNVFQEDIGQVSMTMIRIAETGNLRGFGKFQNFMREALAGVKNFSKLSPEKRFEIMSKAMEGLGPASDKMTAGLSGTMARLQMFFNDVLRDVGGPTFKYIVDQASQFQKYLESTNSEGKKMSSIIGKDILDAVKEVGKIVGFVADHWEAIAITIAGIKIIQLTNDLGGFILKLGEAVLQARALATATALAGAGGGGAGTSLGVRTLAGLGTRLAVGGGMAAVGLAGYGVYKGLSESSDRIEAARGSAKSLEGSGISTFAAFGKSGTKDQMEAAQKILAGAGVLDEDGRLTPQFAQSIEFVNDAFRKQMAGILGIDTSGLSTGMASAMIGERVGKIYSMALPMLGRPAAAEEKGSEGLTKQGKPTNVFNGGIHISQKFDEADPDNVFVQITDGINNEVGARTRSRGAGSIPEAP